MYLIIDAGNTNIKFVFISKDKIIFSVALPPRDLKKLSKEKFKNIIPSNVFLGSVVPSLNKKIAKIIKKIFNQTTNLIAPDDFKTVFDLSKFNLKTQGVDILAFAYYIAKKHKTGVGVSFGTATFSVFVKDGKLLGSSICPGIESGISVLEKQTELINTKDFHKEINNQHNSFYGTNTKFALLSGARIMALGVIMSSQKEFQQLCSGAFTTIISGGKTSFLNIDKSMATYIDNVVSLGYYLLKK